METKIRPNEASVSRWHRTGFISGGVASVDADKHALRGAVMVRPGEALGHGLWIDQAFCAQVNQQCNTGTRANGLKARFGHPNMCNEALGTFLGRWKGATIDADGFVRADLFLSSTAAESPKGDLRKYVEEMAAKEPQHFGASIVFTRDQSAERAFLLSNGAVEGEDEYGKYIDVAGFKSPDAANVGNLPHARCSELHAADLVDDPAATDGMFSGAAGLSLAASMTEYLDTHPEVFAALNSDPSLVDVLASHADKLKDFMARYVETVSVRTESHTVIETTPDAAEPAAVDPEPEAPEGDDGMTAKVGELTAQLSAAHAEVESAKQALTAAQDAVAAIKIERDALAAKLAAIESGRPPLSAEPSEGNKRGSMWDDARKSGKGR